MTACQGLHNTVGSVQNALGAAVILLKLDDPGAREIPLEPEDVLHVGTAPAVDGLVVVADCAHVVLRWRKEPDQLVLGEICILILVDQQMLKTVTILF